MVCNSPLEDIGCLAKWIQGLGVLGVFWAKRVRRLEPVSEDPLALALEWQRSRRSRRAFLALCYEFSSDCMDRLQSLAGSKPADLLLATGSELPRGLYDRWGKVFIYGVNGPFLEPNREIIVNVHEPGRVDDSVVLVTEAVQRSSWGFYKPPPAGDYVFIARLPGGEPVGSAYYNPVSSNIDYGVHVSRPYWRRRIGTRLLVEAARLAGSLGCRWISVVRVLRGVRPTLSDRRAIAFYRANSPEQELNVYRLAMGPGLG